MSAQLAVVRRKVTAAREQMQPVHVDRQTGYGWINATSELWLCDEHSKECRYSGDKFGVVQPEHKVAVARKRFSGTPLALANFTIGRIYDGKKLTINTSPGAILISAFGFNLILALLGALIWATILGTISLGDRAFSTTGHRIFALLLVASNYMSPSRWYKRSRECLRELRKEIDLLLSDKDPQQEG